MLLQQEQLGNVANAANAIAGISFLVAAWFLRDFVKTVKDFMEGTRDRLSRLETLAGLQPEEVGQYSPPRRPRTFHRRD
jgi:hypothetical protein